MNKKLIMIIVVCVIALTIISIYSVNHIVKGKMKDNKDLEKLIGTKIDHKECFEISYSSSGDSNGNLDTMDLDLRKKTLECRFANYHYEPIKQTIFSVSDEDIDDIINHIEKYNLLSYSELPMSDLMPMDAATTSISISCVPKEKNKVRDKYTIYYLMEFPDGAFEHVKELEKKLDSLKKEENKIKSGNLKVD